MRGSEMNSRVTEILNAIQAIEVATNDPKFAQQLARLRELKNNNFENANAITIIPIAVGVANNPITDPEKEQIRFDATHKYNPLIDQLTNIMLGNIQTKVAVPNPANDFIIAFA